MDSCECGVRGIVADGRKEKKKEKREKKRKEKKRREYIFQTFQNVRREVSRGTVHEVVAHELRSRGQYQY